MLFVITTIYDPTLALPLGVPSGKGLYLTVYPLSRPNTDTVDFATEFNAT